MAEKEEKKQTTKSSNTKNGKSSTKTTQSKKTETSKNSGTNYKIVGKAKSNMVEKPETKVAGKVTIEEKAQKQIEQANKEPKKVDSKTKKSKNIVIPVILIIALIVIMIVLMFGGKISNKIKLDKEINNVFNGTATDEIKTTGDYAVIEEAIKNYHKLFLAVQETFMSKIEDEKIQNMLTPSNYEEDGPDFTESLNYIETAKEEFNTAADDLLTLLNEQAVMAQIEDKELSDYYINLYKSYFFDGTDLTEVYESVYNEIDETKSIMNNLYDNETNILNFLSENKDYWKIENSKLSFDSSTVSAQYNSLLVQLNAQ